MRSTFQNLNLYFFGLYLFDLLHQPSPHETSIDFSVFHIHILQWRSIPPKRLCKFIGSKKSQKIIYICLSIPPKKHAPITNPQSPSGFRKAADDWEWLVVDLWWPQIHRWFGELSNLSTTWTLGVCLLMRLFTQKQINKIGELHWIYESKWYIYI